MTAPADDNGAREQARALVATIPAWHHQFEIAPGVLTPGTYRPESLLEKMALPGDLSGRRVLDLGASDGFFSLRLRQRGAQVVAVDYRPKAMHGFHVMEQLSGLDFDYRQANLYELSRQQLGTFDIVLFLGLLYHLPDMVKAISIVRSLCSDQMFLETHCATHLSPEISAARYYRGRSLHDDLTNFWSPNELCLREMLSDCSFSVERTELFADRCFAACRISENSEGAYKLRLPTASSPAASSRLFRFGNDGHTDRHDGRRDFSHLVHRAHTAGSPERVGSAAELAEGDASPGSPSRLAAGFKSRLRQAKWPRPQSARVEAIDRKPWLNRVGRLFPPRRALTRLFAGVFSRAPRRRAR